MHVDFIQQQKTKRIVSGFLKKSYVTTGAHIAFLAKNRKNVEDFYNAGINAGGKDNGKPGLRPDYGLNYFGAFILDPDGNNIEAVTRAT